MRACQSGTATPPFRQSPPQQRGVQQKRGSSRRPFNDMRKRHSLQREQARQADETWRSPASRGAVAMDMPWSLLDGAQCMLEACCWYRNQQSVRECSSKYPPTVFRFSSATYSVAMKAALLRIGACSTPLSCRTSQSRRRRLGEERGSRSMRFCMCADLRSIACLHGRIFHPLMHLRPVMFGQRCIGARKRGTRFSTHRDMHACKSRRVIGIGPQ